MSVSTDFTQVGDLEITLHPNAMKLDFPQDVEVDGRILRVKNGQVTKSGRLFTFMASGGGQFVYTSGFIVLLMVNGLQIWSTA